MPSGLSVSLALVLEAIAFAFVAGVAPLVGLYAAFVVGLITAVIDGQPGMISGATGALAVVMVAFVAQHGVQYLFATVILMGIMKRFAVAMRWGKFIRMVPRQVIVGFVNELAIVIGLVQIDQFKITNGAGQSNWLSGDALILTTGLVIATMVLIWLTPRLIRLVPAPLLAIGVVTCVTVAEDLAVAVVVGVIMSALVYGWNAAKRINASTRPSVHEAGALVHDIQGPLFSGST